MPSPPRQSRNSPPRRALHERSESQINERSKSSLRAVEDSEPYLYRESPYPIKSSQILLPSGQHPDQHSIWRGTRFGEVPLGNTTTLPQEEEPSKGNRLQASRLESDVGRVTGRSSADLSFYTASARDSTAFATPLQERSNSSLAFNLPATTIRKVPDDIGYLPTAGFKVAGDDGAPAAFSERQPSTKDSDNSLSSENSTGTVIVKKTRDGKKRVSYSAFPYTGRPSSSRSNVSAPTSQNSSPRIPDEQPVPHSPVSPILPVNFLPGPRNASAPAKGSKDSKPDLQYPIIKPPSASGSWANSTLTTPQIPPRALERAQQRWNPHLSTVQSERTNSTSGERSSQNLWLPDSSRASNTSSNILSPHMSSEMPPLPTRDNSGIGQAVSIDTSSLNQCVGHSSTAAIPTPVHQRNSTGSTIRFVDDRNEETLNVPPTIPGSRDSDIVQSKPLSNRNAGVVARPGSRASFFRDSIPAWAKTYYSRPMSSSSVIDRRDSTSTDNISINVFRPRKMYDRRQSGLSMHPTRPDDINLDGITGPTQRRISPSWSPHLWHDRTSLGRRRTIFQAPSDGQVFDGRALTKRNVQILMFALGFVFPLSWFIAAFLPLPSKPNIPTAKGKNKVPLDLEKQLCPTDLSRYETARWWRNVNRIMCTVGVVVIVIIIVLAVVAATA